MAHLRLARQIPWLFSHLGFTAGSQALEKNSVSWPALPFVERGISHSPLNSRLGATKLSSMEARTMKCSAKAIANYFLQRHPREISHLKLQKLVYISHGWHLGIFGTPLVEDELAEAWRYGPVFPSLYHEFKVFESKPIDKLATDIEFFNALEKGVEKIRYNILKPGIDRDDIQKVELLDKIWKGYGNLTAVQLSDLTHADGTPWFDVWNTNPGFRNLHIDNEIIKAHYQEKLRKINESANS